MVALALWRNWTVLDGAKNRICQARLNRIWWQNSVYSATLKKGPEAMKAPCAKKWQKDCDLT